MDELVRVCWRHRDTRHQMIVPISVYREWVTTSPRIHSVALVSNTAEAEQTPGSGSTPPKGPHVAPRPWHPSEAS